MKYKVGDRVRIVTWSVPAVTHVQEFHRVCGRVGAIVKARAGGPDEGSDGGYKVRMDDDGREWYFRACDIVSEDSPCTCDNTVRRQPVGECPVHEHPDFDPAQAAVTALAAIATDLERHLEDS